MAKEEWWEGFDDYPGTSTAGVGVGSYWFGSPTSLQPGRFGYQCLRQNRNQLYRAITSNETQIVIGSAFRIPVVSNNNVAGTGLFSFMLGTGYQFVVGTDNLGRIVGGTSQDGSRTMSGIRFVSDRAIAENAWHYIEIAIEIADAGSVTIWLDGLDEPAISYSGDTKSLSGVGVDRFGLNGNTETGGGADFDDMYCRSGTLDRFGEAKLHPLYATEDGAVMWVPLSGSDNFDMINELTCDQDTTYNSSNTMGDKDFFVLEDITDSPSEIFGVMLSTSVRKDDAATRVIKNKFLIDSNEYDGTDFAVTGNYLWNRQIFMTNPDTGVAWTKSDINDMQVGYELVE